jgi:hypothetical protein
MNEAYLAGYTAAQLGKLIDIPPEYGEYAAEWLAGYVAGVASVI